jgi:5-dehydro-4-deoxyglucarate dehydratase
MAHFSPQQMAARLVTDLLAFPITHFNADLSLNEGKYRDHLSWLIEARPAGVFAAGGTGEFFSLTPEEVEQVTAASVDVVKGSMPVLAGAGYGTAMAIDLAKRAERAGADGILLLPPYLLNASQEGLAAHVEAVCKATSLGVIVYSRDNAIYHADTLARLCESCPNLVGLKDGVGDIELMVRVESLIGDRLIYIGGLPTAETFALPYLTMGVSTYSSAMFNFMPTFARSFARAVRAGDMAAIKAGLRDFVLPYTAIRNRGKGYAVSIVKAAATITGRPAGPLRPPLTALDPKSLADLTELMQRVGDRDLKPVERAA